MADDQNRRQALLYWRQMQQLKASACYMKIYRNRLDKKIKNIDILKAVASSGSIAGWFAFTHLKILWSIIIACSQLADVMKMVFPITKQHRQAIGLTVALETLFIDAERDWEFMQTDTMEDAEIIEKISSLKKMQLECENKYFPDGFNVSDDITALATQEASAYFTEIYQVESTS